MSEELHLRGEVSFIPYPRNGYFFSEFEYAIFKFRLDNGNVITVKGETFPIYKGQRLKLTGEEKTSKGEKFLKLSSTERDFDHRNGIRDFLIEIAGIQTSKRLIEHFGDVEGVLSVLKRNPRRLEEVKGIATKKRENIQEKYEKNMKIENVFREFKQYGLTMKECSRIVSNFGSDAVEKIKSNPYRLSFKFLSFKRCDEIAQMMNKPMDSPERNIAAMIEVLKNEMVNGNTYIEKDEFFRSVKRLLSSVRKKFLPSPEKIKTAFDIFLKKGWGQIIEKKYIYLTKSYSDEKDIRDFVKNTLENYYESSVTEEDIVGYEEHMRKKIPGFAFGPEQKEAILRSSRNRISVITGGPGTGKTTILDAIIYTALKTYNESDIALCSPTGKAARRMTEATGMKASTIHTLLKVDPTDHNLEKFVYNKDNKLPYKMIVIDEASMIDQSIAASLLRAIDKNAKVIFVGDIEQLPPVGAGYFLRDLIESIGEETASKFGETKVSRLLKTYRQAEKSTIVRLSQKIRDNDLKTSDLEKRDDFLFVPYNGDPELIVNIFLKAVARAGVEQSVVLSPQNKGEIGVQELNKRILETQIPFDRTKPEIQKNGWIFREGAKVMQTRNNNEKGLVNGQIGYIQKIDLENKTLYVMFDDHLYEYDSEMTADLVLGYALTVHKSQGSEWRYVIEVVSKKHYNNTKALIYTGITRAKQGLVIVGDEKTLLEAPRKKEKEPKSRIINNFR